MSLLDSFTNHLKSGEFLSGGEAVLLAVSGGLDSVVLLDLFSRVKTPQRLELAVCHVNHGLRGSEAKRDQQFVEKLAADYDLPCVVKTVDTRSFMAEHKSSPEEAARILRYRALTEVLASLKFDKVATGHTKDDLVETVVHNFLRGTGVRGLTGIPARRGVIFRPLLVFSRADIQRYAQERKLSFVEDSTNTDLDFTRNRIRHELLPYVKKHFNPKVDDTLFHTSAIFAEVEAYLSHQAKQAFKSLVFLQEKNEIVLDIDGFLSYFTILQKEVLSQVFARLQPEPIRPDFARVRRILGLIQSKKVGKRVSVNSDIEVLVDHDGIVVRKRHHRISEVAEIDLNKETRLDYAGYRFVFTRIGEKPKEVRNSNPLVEFLDADKFGPKLNISPFTAGERFRPLNMRGTKKIADYFSDKKIPLRKREGVPIVRSGRQVVWVAGLCLDDRAKIDANTKKVLKIEMEKRDDP